MFGSEPLCGRICALQLWIDFADVPCRPSVGNFGCVVRVCCCVNALCEFRLGCFLLEVIWFENLFWPIVCL